MRRTNDRFIDSENWLVDLKAGLRWALKAVLFLSLLALAACGKKDSIAPSAPAEEEVFEIFLPSETDGELRDYTTEDLGVGDFKAERIGLKVEYGATVRNSGYSVEFRHFLNEMGAIDQARDALDQIFVREGNYDGLELFVTREFFFPLETEFRQNLSSGSSVIGYPIGYMPTLGSDGSISIETFGSPSSDTIEVYVPMIDEHRISRGVYDLTSQEHPGRILIRLNPSGYSMFFELERAPEKITGRVDYRRVQ